MSETSSVEQLAFVIDALRRHQDLYRRSGLTAPAGVGDLVSEVGFRVMLGQAGSLSPDAGAGVEKVGRLEPIAVRYETAAQLLGVSVSTIKRLVKAGDLPAIQVGPGATRVRVVDLHSFLTAPNATNGVGE